MWISILLVCALAVISASAKTTPLFMKGLSSAGNDNASVAQIAAVHATHVRRYIMWGSFTPVLHSLETNLSLEALRADPERLIYQWADENINWAYGDEQVYNLLAQNITPVVEVSEGTHYGLPRYQDSYADPSIIGVDLYFAYQYRFCRAAVHRYKHVVHLWQIENELNEALLAGVDGQRIFNFLWGNWTFLTDLLVLLRDAVKEEDPTALLTMNFHTDVPEVVHDVLHLPGFYVSAIQDWAQYLDIIAIDAYPNMFVATPLGSSNVSDRVSAALQAVNHTKDCFVMETGYPVVEASVSANASTPSIFNYSFASQELYISNVVQDVFRVGGSGLFYFKFTASPGMQPPPGGYTAKDVSFFDEIRNILWTNNVTGLIDWLLEPGDFMEVLERASFFLSEPDKAGWGVFNMDGSPRPAVDALRVSFGSL